MPEPVAFPDDPATSYIFLAWSDLGDIVTTLSHQILTSGKKFDRLVALATGGHTMSRALKDYLNIPRLSSMQISFYTGIGKRGETPIITQSLATSVEGEHILLFDDVNDTGSTLETARKYLELRGIASCTTATLITKSHTSFPSDFSGKKLDHWIIFADEIRETITHLLNKWSEAGLPENEIITRLKTIGFTDEHLTILQHV